MHMMLLVVGCLAPVLQGVRDIVLGVDGETDPNGSELKARNKALSAEVSRLRLLVQKHGLALKEPDEGLGDYASAGEDISCCCKLGRCAQDEQGADGSRAVEVFKPDRCCKGLATSTGQCPRPWISKASDADCTSAEKQMLDGLLTQAMSSKGHTKQECRKQLSAVFQGITDWASSISLHGHWIHSIRAIHFSETVAQQLFVSGFAFGIGDIGARLFQMPQGTKLLWSGISPRDRATWKGAEDAGELSEDTEMGHIIHRQLGDRLFDCCDFGATVLTFWQTASSSLLNVQHQKPLLILINKTKEQIADTIFWNAEVPSLALNPPQSTIRLVSFQMTCKDLVEKLTERIVEIVGNTQAAELRWSGVTNMTCEEPPHRPWAYPPPLWRAERLRAHGLGPKYLGELGMTAMWLHDRGFALKDVRQAGRPLPEIQKLLERNFKRGDFATELKEAGFPLGTILNLQPKARRNGINVASFRQLGFSAKELMKEASRDNLKIRLSAKELREAGYSATELKEAGFNLKACDRSKKFLFGELQDANYSGSELRDAGFTAWDLKDVGADPAKYADGFSCEDIFRAFGRGEIYRQKLTKVCNP